MQTVFMVEDDDDIREMVLYALGSSGFLAEGFAEAGPFYDRLDTAMPDLVILDIMLPGASGTDILKTLRAGRKTAALPVIMLTAKGAEYDRIHGLDLGADDYITKPFSVMEVIARVRAVLRRSEAPAGTAAEVKTGDIVINTEKRTVTAAGEKCELTYKEFELLYYLMMNAGIVLTRDQLLDALWGYEYDGESRTVDMHVRSLRQKLGPAGQQIKTVRNIGYKIEE